MAGDKHGMTCAWRKGDFGKNLLHDPLTPAAV